MSLFQKENKLTFSLTQDEYLMMHKSRKKMNESKLSSSQRQCAVKKGGIQNT